MNNNFNDFAVQSFYTGKDLLSPMIEPLFYGNKEDALFYARHFWATGEYQMINVTDLSPLKINKYPEISMLLHRSTKYGCKLIESSHDLQFQIPDFPDEMTDYLHYPIPANSYAIVLQNGDTILKDNLNYRCSTSEILERIFLKKEIFGYRLVLGQLFFDGFYVDGECAFFTFS